MDLRYFIALGEEKGVQELPRLTMSQKKALCSLLDRFTDREAATIKKYEKTTNHDVKACEYYLKEKVKKIPGLKKYTEFVHFG